MPSKFAQLFETVGIPVIQKWLTVPAIYLPNSVAQACTVMLENGLEAVGSYGERMEYRPILTVVKSLNAGIGDVFEIDQTYWTLKQLISDDGYFQKYAVMVDE